MRRARVPTPHATLRAPASSGPSPTAGVAGATAATAATPAHPIPRKRLFIYEVPPGTALTEVTLKGSWTAEGAYAEAWAASHTPMKEVPPGSGHWEATVALLDDGQPHPWRWGVDLRRGAQSKPAWGMASVTGVPFEVPGSAVVRHAPVTYQQNGARRLGHDDLSFRAWFPNAEAVVAKLVSPETGEVRRVPLRRDAEAGWWRGLVAHGFDAHLGWPYVYEVTAAGKTIERSDPYARDFQGEQRCVRPLFLAPDGHMAMEFTPGREELLWFSVDDDFAAGVDEAFLVFKDAAGAQVSADALRQRLGPTDAGRVARARGGAFDDFWDRSGGVEADGRIRMTKVGRAFSAVLHNPQALEGLRYELQRADGRPLGDVDGDGALSARERAVSANDPYGAVLTAESWKSPRMGLVTDALPPPAPREPTPSSVVYQAHVGSFMSSSQNVDRSTFEDLLAHLDYLQALGVTDVQILPPAEVGGLSWGYEGVSSLATESSYGFVDGHGADARWVSGREAFRRFVDAAHAHGINVIADVVLNHLYEPVPQRWMHDGTSANVWFNQRPDDGTDAPPKYFETDWGTVPAFNNPAVAQFLTDYVLSLALEIGVDGIRFDFTQPIVDSGGAALLQRINSLLEAVGVRTRIAENFPYQRFVDEEIGRGGLGFSDQLYVAPNHLLVDDAARRSLLLEAALRRDDSELDVDAAMALLTSDPQEFSRGWASATVGLTTHDEVGNGARMAAVAQGLAPRTPADPWAAKAVRAMHGIGALGPGARYMLFEGEESLATHAFRWGQPSTWSGGSAWLDLGADWHWESLHLGRETWARVDRLLALPDAQLTAHPDYAALGEEDRKVLWFLRPLTPAERERVRGDIARRQTALFVKDLLALRRGSLGDTAGTRAERVYTHKRDGVMAFRRKATGGDLVVAVNLSRKNLTGYDLHLPPGRWKEILNSDGVAYGGDDFGNAGGTFSPGQTVNLPQGGVVVFRETH